MVAVGLLFPGGKLTGQRDSVPVALGLRMEAQVKKGFSSLPRHGEYFAVGPYGFGASDLPDEFGEFPPVEALGFVFRCQGFSA